ncbi:substrate-binding domain-containing protein [Streptomyces sp. KM273126]|uniref:substrate-binding domain-containing protein n=1 Tax=Streptomyces sp. KM273126 TaxID=2545247 RepID=UPI00103E4F9A|nr:substrate-binding domain-containing protein [Streptomyces sp. KM273126]MBA2811176.1 substrate-binding domain-containing protein [Streptomyces sp. KM273126]
MILGGEAVCGGHRRIAHIVGNHAAVFDIRHRVYQTSMCEHGHEDDILVETRDTIENGGYLPAVRLLGRSRPRPTAVFVANDPARVGAFSVAVELGLSVPAGLSPEGAQLDRACPNDNCLTGVGPGGVPVPSVWSQASGSGWFMPKPG